MAIFCQQFVQHAKTLLHTTWSCLAI